MNDFLTKPFDPDVFFVTLLRVLGRSKGLVRVGRKALLQFKSAHAWHAHVQHQTARPRGVVTVDEGLRRAKILDPQAHRLDQPAQAARHGLVVINYEYCRLVHGDGIVVR
jgi:hypothetical protein